MRNTRVVTRLRRLEPGMVTDSHGVSASSKAFVTVTDQTPPSIGQVSVQKQSQGHGMMLLTLGYTAIDNCGAVKTALSVTSDGDNLGSQVLDAHHVLLNNGRGRGSDEEDEGDEDAAGRRVSFNILATDEAGNESFRTITIGGRRTHR